VGIFESLGLPDPELALACYREESSVGREVQGLQGECAVVNFVE